MTASSTLSHRGHSEMTPANALLFTGCFIALITTAFGFIARMFLISTWAVEFDLDPAKSGQLAGIGIWPFAVSIIGFSLIIDRIGYKVAMLIAFVGHITWAVMGVSAYFLSHDSAGKIVTDPAALATAYRLLYWGSLILGLGNGTVEAFINPVVATLFHREKTKWLNILHAGWPGGLVAAGIVTIYLDYLPWWVKVGIIAVPALLYLIILLPCHFPVQERSAAGVSYKEMLSQFGVLGAAVVGFLLYLQLVSFFEVNGQLDPMLRYLFIGISVAVVLGFGVYTQSLGSLFLFFMILIMMPLATTEIGTDGWITAIMEEIAKGKFHPGWVLVYTSVIMMVMRFFAGPIVHAISPLGLLAVSSVLAIAGLVLLSSATGMMIFAAATLYAFGKTFFWPTMLGVVSEQTPKGGVLTLNAISGIGMLAVGTLGFPYIGTLQSNKEIAAIERNVEIKKEAPGLYDSAGKLTVLEDRLVYDILPYKAISDEKLKAALPPENAEKLMTEIAEVRGSSKQGALLDMAMFPTFMLVCYLILIAYFASKGGYKPIDLLKNIPDDRLPSEDGMPIGGNGDGIQLPRDQIRSGPR